jgi:chromosome segregation ATPase
MEVVDRAMIAEAVAALEPLLSAYRGAAQLRDLGRLFLVTVDRLTVVQDEYATLSASLESLRTQHATMVDEVETQNAILRDLLEQQDYAREETERACEAVRVTFEAKQREAYEAMESQYAMHAAELQATQDRLTQACEETRQELQALQDQLNTLKAQVRQLG